MRAGDSDVPRALFSAKGKAVWLPLGRPVVDVRGQERQQTNACRACHRIVPSGADQSNANRYQARPRARIAISRTSVHGHYNHGINERRCMMTGAKPQRRGVQNYFEMGFNVGDQMIFDRLPHEIVEILDGRQLLWGGSPISLTMLREKLGPQLNLKKYSGKITVNGYDFDERYKKIYGPPP
jgi:hypothetical protein